MSRNAEIKAGRAEEQWRFSSLLCAEQKIGVHTEGCLDLLEIINRVSGFVDAAELNLK